MISIVNINSEEAARQTHDVNSRKNKPFVSIDCSKITNLTLLESELFGHEKGSFIGAYARKIGLVEIANGGSLFLQDPPYSVMYQLSVDLIFRLGGRDRIEVDVHVYVAKTSEEDKVLTLAELEKREIIARLTANNNKTQVAMSLGITIKTLYNKLHLYGLWDRFSIHKAKEVVVETNNSGG